MVGFSLNKKVLILNQSYEPLSVITARKAIVLVYRGKAEIIEEHPELLIRSIWISYPFPSIIRLNQYVRLPHKDVVLTRKNIIKRDGHRCQYCGSTLPPLTVDHIVPKRQGGADAWENLVCACFACNNKKGDRTPEQADMQLIAMPKKPHFLHFIQMEVKIIEDHWKPYLFLS